MSSQNPVFIPGPTNIPERLRAAVNVPTIDHRSAEFTALFRPLFQGVKDVLKMQEGEVVFFPATGTAGEIGHVQVDEDGPLCRCGNRGCLEAVASGRAIARVFGKSSPKSIWTNVETTRAVTAPTTASPATPPPMTKTFEPSSSSSAMIAAMSIAEVMTMSGVAWKSMELSLSVTCW